MLCLAYSILIVNRKNLLSVIISWLLATIVVQAFPDIVIKLSYLLSHLIRNC